MPVFHVQNGTVRRIDVKKQGFRLEQELHNLFHNLREQILNLSEVEERANQKTGITYRTTKAIAHFEFRRRTIDLHLHRSALNEDPEERLEDITSYKWRYPYRFRIARPDDTAYALRLITAVYNATQ